MEEVLHANIFFFISSIATILFSLLLCIALYQIIKILRSVRTIVERVEAGSEVIAEDISQLRSLFLQGSIVSRILGMMFGVRPDTSDEPKRRRRKHGRGASITITDDE